MSASAGHGRAAGRTRAEDAQEAWIEKWAPPCPLGDPQELLTLLGFRQKSVDCLQLRVVLGWRDGICAVIVDERPDLVYVRVLACHPEDEADDRRDPDRSREDLDSPCRTYLDAPLGERIVIDVDSGELLPMFIPALGYRRSIPVCPASCRESVATGGDKERWRIGRRELYAGPWKRPWFWANWPKTSEAKRNILYRVETEG